MARVCARAAAFARLRRGHTHPFLGRLGGPPRLGGRKPMSISSPISFGPPPDAASIAAVVIAVLLASQGRAILGALLRVPRKMTVAFLAAIAIALSAGYVHHYLRGGPRIIDATS